MRPSAPPLRPLFLPPPGKIPGNAVKDGGGGNRTRVTFRPPPHLEERRKPTRAAYSPAQRRQPATPYPLFLRLPSLPLCFWVSAEAPTDLVLGVVRLLRSSEDALVFVRASVLEIEAYVTRDT